MTVKESKNKKEKVGMKYLLSLADKENKRKIYISIGMSVLSGLVSFVPFIAIFKCVASMFNKSNDYKEMFTWGIIALVSIVLRFLFQGISLSLSHVGAYDVLYSVRKRLCNHIGKINLGFFTDNSIGEIKRVLMEDVERLEIFLAHQLPDIVSAIVVPVTVLIFLFTVNVPMTLMMIVPIILTFCLQALEMLVAKDVIAEIPNIVGRLNSGIMQFISGMTVMQEHF